MEGEGLGAEDVMQNGTGRGLWLGFGSGPEGFELGLRDASTHRLFTRAIGLIAAESQAKRR